MTKIKTSQLAGRALNWAVAKCEGFGDPFLTNGGSQTVRKYLTLDRSQYTQKFLWEMGYSTNWGLGGPIIERELISVLDANGCWAGRKTYWDNSKPSCELYGPTPLIAAMRCYVASKLGDEVDVPFELSDV